jgi:NADH dehydrogenase
VFVIGDMASIRCAKTGQPVPGVAPAAMQMGTFVAGIIARETSSPGAASPREAFRYHDKGSMATIGRAKAVAEVGKLRFSGLPAWLAWLLIHLVLLVGFHNRVLVFLSWAFAYVSFTKGSRIITGDIPSRIVRPLGNRDGDDPAGRARSMALLKGRM